MQSVIDSGRFPCTIITPEQIRNGVNIVTGPSTPTQINAFLDDIKNGVISDDNIYLGIQTCLNFMQPYANSDISAHNYARERYNNSGVSPLHGDLVYAELFQSQKDIIDHIIVPLILAIQNRCSAQNPNLSPLEISSNAMHCLVTNDALRSRPNMVFAFYRELVIRGLLRSIDNYMIVFENLRYPAIREIITLLRDSQANEEWFQASSFIDCWNLFEYVSRTMTPNELLAIIQGFTERFPLNYGLLKVQSIYLLGNLINTGNQALINSMNELHAQLDVIGNNILSLEQKIQILRQTNQLLLSTGGDERTQALATYQTLALTIKGSPSPALRRLCIAMCIFSACIVGLGVAAVINPVVVIPAAVVALMSGVGFFFASRQSGPSRQLQKIHDCIQQDNRDSLIFNPVQN